MKPDSVNNLRTARSQPKRVVIGRTYRKPGPASLLSPRIPEEIIARLHRGENPDIDAITQTEVLAREAPDNGILASDLVETQQILGLLLGHTGRTKAGIQILETALAFFASLTPASIKDQRRDQWFTVRANLANR